MATYAAKLDRVSPKNMIDNIVRSGLTSADIDVFVKGTAFYVDSVTGSAGNDGLSWDTALATIDSAINKCTANKGDCIFVAPYHQEVKAAAGDLFTLDVAGVSVIGVSNGCFDAVVASGVATYHNAPVLILDHADATITMSAVNTRISGFAIISDVADVKVGVTVAATADGASVDNCYFRDNAANLEFLVGISVAAAALRVQIVGNKFYTTAAAGTNNAILLAGANTGLIIKDNVAFGKFATGCLLGSAAAQVQAYIAGNTFVNAEAAIAIALHTSSTGILASNYLGGAGSTIAAVLTGDNALWCFENYIADAVAGSGVLNPAAVVAD
jgi:hypothetical protein